MRDKGKYVIERVAIAIAISLLGAIAISHRQKGSGI